MKFQIKAKESGIELAICHYLFHQKACFYKQNTRGFYNSKKGKFIKDLNPFARTGVPDISVFYKGFYLGLEVKTPDGKQSESQIEFEKYLEEKGQCPYRVVRSVDDAERIYSRFKAYVDKFYLTYERGKELEELDKQK